MTEETFGVAPGWGRDGLYVGRAANMEVAPAALGKRSRVTGETVGAVSGGDAGKWGPRRLERWKSCKMRIAPAARGAAFARDGRDVWGSAGVRQRRLVCWKGFKHGGCTPCVGAMIARDGRDVRSSIGNDAGQRDSDGSHVGKIANMEVAPAARGQRSCKHGGCTRCVGATLARDGRDVRSSIVCLCVCLCLSVCFSVCVCL